MKKTLLILIILFYSACSHTTRAWNSTPVKEYLEVYGKEDLPSQLEAKKVEYRCVDLIYSSEGYTKKCYVTKDSAKKVDDWSSKLYETSKGILLDTGENVIILGLLMLCNIGSNCANVDFSHIRIKE
ncbi:MAG: hypothetical protein GXO60_05525 [Epsilonproteobacteria bacterium]|nr:hypothetical protein [Campylobacterota bacterium]